MDFEHELEKEQQSHDAEIRRICTVLRIPDYSTIEDIVKEIEKLKRLSYQLGDAARLINCSGPVPERIQVLKTHYSNIITKLEGEIVELKSKITWEWWSSYDKLSDDQKVKVFRFMEEIKNGH